MRILQLVPRLPFPPDDGGRIGILGILDSFIALGHDVKVCAFDEDNYQSSFIAARGSQLSGLVVEGIPSQRVVLSKIRVGLGVGTYLLDKYGSSSLRDRVMSEYSSWRPDLVHIDHSHMGAYGLEIKKHDPSAVVCLRAHNVEHLIWERRASLAPDPVRRAIFRRQAVLTEKVERELFSNLDAVASISPVDSKVINAKFPRARVLEMPAGYGLNRAAPLRVDISRDPKLSFIGSLDYTANLDGLSWFVAHVWPKIIGAFPGARLTVVGKSSKPLTFLRDVAGVTYLGFVDDLDSVAANTDIAIVPLRVGGGIRLKILDFLSRGLPIVSTSVGAEGLPLEHEGVNVVSVADTPDDFLRCMHSLVASTALREQMATAGRKLIAARFDWKSIVAEYLGAVMTLRPDGSRRIHAR